LAKRRRASKFQPACPSTVLVGRVSEFNTSSSWFGYICISVTACMACSHFLIWISDMVEFITTQVEFTACRVPVGLN
jgi:hypothetical protein